MFERPSSPRAPAIDDGGAGLLQQQVVLSFGTSAPKAGAVHWEVRSVRLSERISGPYHVRIRLSTRDPRVLANEMRGRDAWLTIGRGRKKRIVRGFVTRVTEGSAGGMSRIVDVVLEPALALLRHTRGSRIFANKTVPEIVKEVLDAALTPLKREVKLDLGPETYEPREYVVQHQETDLDFVARLLAEEGIWYYFTEPDNTDEPEKLILTSLNGKAPPIAKDPAVRLALDEVPDAHEEAIFSFEPAETTVATLWHSRQVNWTNPDSLEQSEKTVEDPSGLSLPVHEYGDLHAIDHAEARYTKHDTERQAQLRLEAERALQKFAEGRSNAILLRPGHRFSADGNEYLLTRVTHDAEAETGNGISSHTVSFGNTLACIALDQVFRPTRVGKPRIAGHAFATVVDASGGIQTPLTQRDGNDISVDAQTGHIRVRVKFHWDETEAKTGGTTSCWVRVAQMWSGAGWGTQFIPRVGMEVIISFEDGDPDRPLILGCVYNGKNRAPYHAKPTQSGFKTASSVDPTRYNELRFEDAKDSEQIFVRAQKDYVEDVLNNHTTTVHAHQTQTVQKTQTETVLGTQALTVVGKRTKTIGGDKENGEENTIFGERKTKVTKKHTEEFLGEHQVTVDATVTEHYRAMHERVVKGPQQFTVETDRIETIAGAYNLTAGVFNLTQGTSSMSMSGDKVAMSTTGGPLTIDLAGTAGLTMDAQGNVAIKANTSISFEVGPNKIVLSMSGVEINGMQIAATAGPSALELGPAGANLKSTMTSVEGQAMCSVKGAMVQLNS